MSKERIIDIKNFKKGQNYQLENAILSNKLNTKYDYIDINVIDYIHYLNNNYKNLYITKNLNSLDLETAQRVLKDFSCDKEFTIYTSYDEYISYYEIVLLNYDSINDPNISFSYISNKKIISFKIKAELLKKFLKLVYRSTDPFEWSYSETQRESFTKPCYIFKGKHVFNLGSFDYLRDNKLTEKIINYILNYK